VSWFFIYIFFFLRNFYVGSCSALGTLIDALMLLGRLSQLGVLSLRDNKLQYLPSEVGNCLELHVLDVSGNR